MKTHRRKGCHKCPYVKAIAAGLFTDVPFTQTPCASCKLEELSLFEIPPFLEPADVAGVYGARSDRIQEL